MKTRKEIAAKKRLPVAAALPELNAALLRSPAALLVAPPGAGKTTAVPLALLEAPWLGAKRIVLLAPRRLAARAAAGHMASLLNEPVGHTVGYRVRLESRVGPKTRIEVITEGILTRMLQSDPALERVGLVIFDEFHERSLEADLGLALSRDVQGVLNEELRLLVMSATLDPAPVAALLNDAPVIRCEGRSFPVETRYIARPPGRSMEAVLLNVIRQSVAANEGNILVFLPGAAEIRRMARQLAQSDLPSQWIIAPLFGNLPRDRQDAAIAPPPEGRRKIVLATAIAETSLTIRGIGVVVDCGLQRRPHFDAGSGMSRLVTLPVSRASADQRRGRAGRLGPGICYRLWHQHEEAAMPAHNRPEMLDADLTALALELAAWGVAGPTDLGWLDPPPGIAFDNARQLLMDLKALGDDGAITAHGRQMAELPLHPRLAHMLLAARQSNRGGEACLVAAVLDERDPIHFTGRWRDADLRLRLEALSSPDGMRRDHTVDPAAVRRITRQATALAKRLKVPQPTTAMGEPGSLLAQAYPDRIAARRPGRSGHYLLSNGRGAVLDPSEPLAAAPWLVAAHLDGDRRDARIFLATAVDPADLTDLLAHRIHWQEKVTWDKHLQAVTAQRQRTLGALVLECQPLQNPSPQQVATALLEGIRQRGLSALPWTQRLRTWQARVNLLARSQAPDGPWPDVSDQVLATTLGTWLGPYLSGLRRLDQLDASLLAEALAGHLNWQQRQRLDQLAPTHISVPSGSRLAIDYQGRQPVLAVRIQEMFGQTTTPTIANGRIALTLHLLSPAGRPAQITGDLAGFWQTSYSEVKKELKGRYPKHYWPDDPLQAAPTSRAKPRKATGR